MTAADLTLWLTLAAILGLLVASAFLTLSETALNAASRSRLRAQADKGSAGAAAALAVTEDGERTSAALSLANTVVNIGAACLATALLVPTYGAAGLALAVAGILVPVVLFGEVMPKALALANAERSAARVAPAIRRLVPLLSPVAAAARAAVRGVLAAFGVRADPDSAALALRNEIAGAIAIGHSAGAVEKEGRDRLLGALDLADHTVQEIMRHRNRIEMIDADATPDAILTQCLASPHSRLPVFRGDAENVLGVIHAKDLLREVDRLVRGAQGPARALADLDILKVATPPYFVPETTALDEQMRQFLKRHAHFALVVDEYGALRGLITLEDILEEIVGEITDEFDTARDPVLKRGRDGDYLVDGAMTIRDLNRAMDWALPDDEANTVAGLVIHEAQMIPLEGQAFSFHGFRFEVVSRRENRLARLKLRPLG